MRRSNEDYPIFWVFNSFLFFQQRDGDTSGMEDSIGPPPARGFRQGPECTARDLADALAKIATSIEPDTQSILGAFHSLAEPYRQFSFHELNADLITLCR